MIYPKLSDGTIDWCVMCKHEGRDLYDGCCECEYSENSGDPPTKYEPKPMTNADRLRAMSDEELADWLDNLVDHCNEGPCFNCFLKDACLNGKMLDWLRQEATE